jgi:hypothetical protein
MPSDRELGYAKGVQHLDRVESQHRGISSSGRIGRKEARITETTRGWGDRAQPGIVKHRNNCVPGGGIIGPPVKEENHMPVSGAVVSVGNFK